MNFKDEFLQAGFTELTLPPEISGRFTPREEIGRNVCGDTFILEENNTKSLFVIKSVSAEASNEAELLHGLSHRGLPVFDAVTEHMGTRYILRKYIHGETLDEYVQTYKTVRQIIDVLIQICDVLYYLHSRPAPIIHRDIKPSNIIITEDGTAVLIDFGISRKYRENAVNDTTYLGTGKFAPPEQFGYSQTDPRSDIYSFGMVIHCLFEHAANPKLKNIAAKCTAFSPDDRFQNAAALKKALLKYKHRVKRFSAAAIMFVVIGFALFYYFRPPIETADTGIPFLEISNDELIQLTAYLPTAHLKFSGDPSLEFVEDRGLRIYNRRYNWDGVDFFVTGLPPGEYLFVAEFSADVPTKFTLNTADSPWTELAVYNGAFTLYTFEYELNIEDVDGISMAATYGVHNGEFSYQNRIRMQTRSPDTDVPYDFYITSIRVYERV